MARAAGSTAKQLLFLLGCSLLSAFYCWMFMEPLLTQGRVATAESEPRRSVAV